MFHNSKFYGLGYMDIFSQNNTEIRGAGQYVMAKGYKAFCENVKKIFLLFCMTLAKLVGRAEMALLKLTPERGERIEARLFGNQRL